MASAWRRRSARPHELVGLLLALEEFDGLDPRERRRRARECAAPLPEAASPDERLFGWLESAPGPRVRERAARVRAALSLARSLLVALGLLFGWALSAALLQVEVHEGRVNIVLCLALLVGVPLVMLVVACLGLVIAARRESTGSVLAWREWSLARVALRLLPQAVREDVERVLGRASANRRLFADVRRAQLFAWSQWLGLGAAFGALAAAGLHVVFTDLAFGWSTTLDVDARVVHRGVEAIASPWARLWPAAAPSLELVESTRHFRVSSQAPHVHFIDPIRYGGWWPFLVMALAVYGCAPRVITAAWGEVRLGRLARVAMARTPGVEALLESLTSPSVETTAEAPEGALGAASDTRVRAIDLATWRRLAGDGEGDGGDAGAIVWAEAIDDEALVARLGTDSLRVRDAGGRRSLDEDAQAITDCGSWTGPVLVCVRAYEPPMLEQLDFLGDLRREIGAGRKLVVGLLGGSDGDRDGWARKLATVGDPELVRLPLDDAPARARGANP